MRPPPIPRNLSIPSEILEFRANGDLTLFIGAGVSQLTGCWGWKRLAENLIDRCLNTGIIDYKERNYLVTENDKKRHMEMISSCFNKFQQNNLIQEYYSIVAESCSSVSNGTLEIYSKLKTLADYYVTTNYDDHFDRYFTEDNIVFRLEDFIEMGKSGREIAKGKYYHIHGSIKEPTSIVLTEDDYSRRYADSDFLTFLLTLFAEHSLLFVGYGLQEPVIRFLLGHAKRRHGSKQHFVLKHYYSDQTVMYDQEREYFGAMGINVISYIGDERDYAELYEILRSWSSEIEETELVVT